MLIGVISDTHGLLRPQAIEALRGVEHVIHAGDVGGADILPKLRKIAPVTAIKGNVDVDVWAGKLPATAVVEFGGISFYVLHNLRAIDLKPKAAGFGAGISGHSHKPGYEFSEGVLYFNPGSAGPRRFKLPVTVGNIEIRNGELFPEIVELAV
jgi:uncharacterized protein